MWGCRGGALWDRFTHMQCGCFWAVCNRHWKHRRRIHSWHRKASDQGSSTGACPLNTMPSALPVQGMLSMCFWVFCYPPFRACPLLSTELLTMWMQEPLKCPCGDAHIISSLPLYHSLLDAYTVNYAGPTNHQICAGGPDAQLSDIKGLHSQIIGKIALYMHTHV